MKINFTITVSVSNSLVADQARHSVGPDLGPNCLQMLSADDTSWYRVMMPFELNIESVLSNAQAGPN